MHSRMVVPALCLTLACGGVETAQEVGTQKQSIINGEACSETESPEAVGVFVQMKYHKEDTMQHGTAAELICVGTLIAPDVVLTAAHCLDPAMMQKELDHQSFTLDSYKFYISYTADLTANATGQTFAVPKGAVLAKSAVFHPLWAEELSTTTGPQRANDIGLIFLSEAQEVTPAVVITEAEAAQIVKDASVGIVGWGFQGPRDWDPIGEKRCGTTTINEVADTEMQIGSDSSSVRKCQGDSGGPTFLDVETSLQTKRRIIGVTSRAYDGSGCTKGGLDTRVDQYLPWINQEMQAACDNQTRVWCDVPGIIPPTYYEPAPVDVDQGSGGETKTSGCATPEASLLALLPLVIGAMRRRRS